MTAIAGLVDGGTVYIGGDSAGVAGYDVVVRHDRKVFRRSVVEGDDMLFGFTSSFRMGQLLRYRLELPAPPPPDSSAEDIAWWMNVEFVDAVRECLGKGGVRKKEHEVEEGGNFLVAYRGRLFEIGPDFQVGETVYGFDACGCGKSYILGSLHATDPDMGGGARPLNGELRVRVALEAAAEFSGGVRGPFVIEALEPPALEGPS